LMLSVTTTRRLELDWLYRGAGRFFPEAWARFRDGVLIREAGQLAGIPGVLIHGRNDLGGGACTPWELARAWPGAELIIIAGPGQPGRPPQARRIPRRPRPPVRADHEPLLAASPPLAGAGHDRAAASCDTTLWARAATRMSSTTASRGIAVESITRWYRDGSA